MDATATLDQQVDRQLESLRREFRDVVPPGQVTRIGQEYLAELRAEARIRHFIPILVYRFTRAELVEVRREDLHDAA